MRVRVHCVTDLYQGLQVHGQHHVRRLLQGRHSKGSHKLIAVPGVQQLLQRGEHIMAVQQHPSPVQRGSIQVTKVSSLPPARKKEHPPSPPTLSPNRSKQPYPFPAGFAAQSKQRMVHTQHSAPTAATSEVCVWGGEYPFYTESLVHNKQRIVRAHTNLQRVLRLQQRPPGQQRLGHLALVWDRP